MNAATFIHRMQWQLRPKTLPLGFRSTSSRVVATRPVAGVDTAPINADAVEFRFRALAARWREETRLMSSLPQIIAHPAYQEIIGLGRPVVPFILREMEKQPEHWGPALQAITGAQPVPREHTGRVKAITEDWLAWAKANGYVW